jgi:hypothetical protein
MLLDMFQQGTGLLLVITADDFHTQRTPLGKHRLDVILLAMRAEKAIARTNRSSHS